VVTRHSGRVQQSRAEEWTYLVRELDDDGIATLEGHLSGFGAGVEVDEQALPDGAMSHALEAEREALGPVQIRLGMDGRLHGLSTQQLDRSLPHELLAMRVPATPIRPGELWPEMALVRAFSELVPIDLQIEVRGEAQVVGLSDRGGVTTVEMSSQGSVRTTDGPSVSVRSTCRWDADRGLLVHRAAEARFAPVERDPIREPGVLSMELTLI